jgi:hypothetical protein
MTNEKQTFNAMVYNKEGMALGLTTITTTDKLARDDKLVIFEKVKPIFKCRKVDMGARMEAEQVKLEKANPSRFKIEVLNEVV